MIVVEVTLGEISKCPFQVRPEKRGMRPAEEFIEAWLQMLS